VTVTISSTTGGASIRYTTDGSTPSETAGTLYSGPVPISTTTTLKAIAYESGMSDSSVTSGVYTLQVAAPTFSPAPGTYTSSVTVTISSTTGGASIRYTTDGSTPSESAGTLYSSPVPISTTTTLKAIAYKSGMSDSSVTSGVYTLQVAAPTFSPGAGSYSSSQNVTISSTTGGASIRYTTDGSTPSESAGTLYSSPVPISTTTTLKAIAYKSGMSDSSVTSGVYTITLQVAAPTFSPGAGNYSSSQNVTISSTTGGASIRYTTDGSTPSETAGTLYSGPVPISTTTTLKAIAYESGMSDSSVTSGVYTLQVAAPTFSPAPGTYTSSVTVTISSTTGGASIRYTTDGSTPSESAGTLYSSPVPISTTTTLKAIAYKSGMSDSSVTSGVYTLQVAAPTFSPGAGSYSSSQNVTISSTTGGASIRYTTDGSTPSESAGTLYSSPVPISTTTTLKAIAYKSGMSDSSVTSGVYTITLQVAAPTFSPGAGNYSSSQNVTIGSTTGGASIRYTTDGSTPSESAGTLYSSPVPISTTTTLKAIAYKSGMSDSSITSGVYTITLQVAAPTFSPGAGSYSSAQSVTISSTTGGASIRYTTDGSTPSESAGTLYSSPVPISTTTTLKAIAYESGMTDSPVTSATYTFGPSVTEYIRLNGRVIAIENAAP
jgi:DNA-binding transcriptional regulator GbsR (MarR family)